MRGLATVDAVTVADSPHMLHRHLLLALAAVAVEGFEQRRVGAGELVRLGKVLSTFAFSLFDNASPFALGNLQTERTEK
jgi:hypothetical protein